jgi:hypothetical protein
MAKSGGSAGRGGGGGEGSGRISSEASRFANKVFGSETRRNEFVTKVNESYQYALNRITKEQLSDREGLRSAMTYQIGRIAKSTLAPSETWYGTDINRLGNAFADQLIIDALKRK